jgi:hypothetical protein
LSKLKNLGIDRVATLSVGWNARGHDGLYPTRFPIEERLGGEAAFREMIKLGREIGYQCSVHDNFQMNVRSRPTSTKRRWFTTCTANRCCAAGGRAATSTARGRWRCPRKKVGGHLRRMKDLGCDGVYYCDYWMAPLEVNYHPRHRGSRSAHQRGMDRVLDEVRRTFGSVGTEFGTMAGALLCDSLATSPPHGYDGAIRLRPEWPITSLLDERTSLWALTLHGLVMHPAKGDPNWRNAMFAIVSGALPADEWGVRPIAMGGIHLFDDRRAVALKAQHDLCINRFGHLATEEMTRCVYEGDSADAQLPSPTARKSKPISPRASCASTASESNGPRCCCPTLPDEPSVRVRANIKTIDMSMKNIAILFVLLLAPTLRAAAQIDIADRRVTVETDRYKVVIDGLTIVNIDNKLTGETYAAPPAADAKPTPTLRQMLGDVGVQVESLRPAVPLKRFSPCERTKVESRKDGADGATVTFTGLQYGAGKDAEFAERMTISLSLRVEPQTGDLIITPTTKGNIEEVFGVRDRGVLRDSLHVLALANTLKMIIPASDGVAFTADNVPAAWNKTPGKFQWPMAWEAALLIAESDRGCLGIWADEPKLTYGRHLALAHSTEGWGVGFEFETNDLIYQCDDIKEASWRLNVFKGYWVNAARRYQDQMIAQWGMKPLTQSAVPWADKIRIAVNGLPNDDVIAQVPRDSIMAFTGQGWLKGWNDGQIHSRKHGDYFPNWPIDNPTRYEAADTWPKEASAAESKGVHVFPYTNATIIDADHPWLAQKIHGHHFHSWRMWQRFYPEQCLDIVTRYGVSAIYEDCSWVMSRHSDNGPDGENWYQGSVRTRENFRQLMPQIGLCGERNNEVTARGQQLALSITQFPENAHPIGCFLFEPFVRVWNLQPTSAGMDPDDVRGFISTWPFFVQEPLQDNAITQKRGEIFAREQLKSVWPETWDPNVLHYFKGKDGAEYRFVRDHGTRFVKMRPDGSSETIYWRLRGATEIDAPGSSITGWIGYAGDKIIGLNPHAPMYVVNQGGERPPAVISSIPEGYVINRSVVRDGYWLATLDLADNVKTLPAPNAKAPPAQRVSKTIRVRAQKPTQFIGAESVKPLSSGEYELQVALPGGFAAVWSDPTEVSPTTPTPLAPPAISTAHDLLNGLVYHQYAKPNLASLAVGEVPQQEIVMTWLVKLPEQPQALHFQYGSTHGYGDGANYMVRVNGQELWKQYRLQTSTDPEKAKAHEAPPIDSASLDLSTFAGQVIVLELGYQRQRKRRQRKHRVGAAAV